MNEMIKATRSFNIHTYKPDMLAGGGEGRKLYKQITVLGGY
jgi:hypothetical protein